MASICMWSAVDRDSKVRAKRQRPHHRGLRPWILPPLPPGVQLSLNPALDGTCECSACAWLRLRPSATRAHQSLRSLPDAACEDGCPRMSSRSSSKPPGPSGSELPRLWPPVRPCSSCVGPGTCAHTCRGMSSCSAVAQMHACTHVH